MIKWEVTESTPSCKRHYGTTPFGVDSWYSISEYKNGCHVAIYNGDPDSGKIFRNTAKSEYKNLESAKRFCRKHSASLLI